MEFLIQSDLDLLVTSTDWTLLTGGAQAPADVAERHALEGVRRLLGNVFQLDTALRAITAWDEDMAYYSGARVLSDAGLLYVSVQDVTPGRLLTNTAYWQQTDDRPAILVEAVAAEMLCVLSLRLSPAPIPKARIDHRDRLWATLSDATRGEGSLPLPKLTDAPVRRIAFGSEEASKSQGWW